VRLFDVEGLMDRYAAIIEEHGVKVTSFLVTSLIDGYRTTIDRLGKRLSVEFGIHSHDHDTQDACSREQVDKAFHAYQAFFGMAPLGYRAPNGLIDKDGLNNLLDSQFQYDASIFPSIRLDEYGYSNLHVPREPFLFVRGGEVLVELPNACLQTIRLVFSLSYVKLMGLGLYRLLIPLFPLPDAVVLDSHPYDFYIPLIAHHLKGWKRLAHLRNAWQAFDVFEQIIKMLKSRGYEFAYMSELSRHIRRMPNTRRISVDELR